MVDFAICVRSQVVHCDFCATAFVDYFRDKMSDFDSAVEFTVHSVYTLGSICVVSHRSAEWVDHRRIYVTGCSMGGMSTWEVGAMRPDLFAAIAPKSLILVSSIPSGKC